MRARPPRPCCAGRHSLFLRTQRGFTEHMFTPNQRMFRRLFSNHSDAAAVESESGGEIGGSASASRGGASLGGRVSLDGRLGAPNAPPCAPPPADGARRSFGRRHVAPSSFQYHVVATWADASSAHRAVKCSRAREVTTWRTYESSVLSRAQRKPPAAPTAPPRTPQQQRPRGAPSTRRGLRCTRRARHNCGSGDT